MLPILNLPSQWLSCIITAFLHTIYPASAVSTRGCAIVFRRKATFTRMKVELAMACQENALLREEADIKDERFHRIAPLRRPHHSLIQRLRILKLKAARN